jgi:hypothetical protein
VARNTAADVSKLARQMARTDERRAASMFHHDQVIGPVRPVDPRELLARLAAKTPPQEAPQRQQPASRDQERTGDRELSDQERAFYERFPNLVRDAGDGRDRDAPERSGGRGGRTRSR